MMKKSNFLGIVAVIVIAISVSLFAWASMVNLLWTNTSPRAQNPAPTTVVPEYQKKDTQVLSRPLSARALRVPILMYHHVGPLPEHADQLREDLTVSEENFEQQVKWLYENGYTTVNLEQVYQSSEGRFVLPKKPVVFTFDDGYSDVFTYAVPILQKYGYAGSFAIITQYVGTADYATWSEISKAKSGGMEIVSHTQNHFDGSNGKFTPDYIYDNLSGSRKDLSDHLGESSRILIYPYGHYTGLYIDEARKAGFEMALTVRFGKYVDPENIFEVPRIRVHGHQNFEKFKENIEK